MSTLICVFIIELFTTNKLPNLLLKRIFQIDKHVAELRTKWLILSYIPFALRFFIKYAELAP